MSEQELLQRIKRLEARLELLNNTAGARVYPDMVNIGQHAQVEGWLTMPEQAAPTTPESGYMHFYPGTDSWPYALNDAGKSISMGVSGIVVPIFGGRYSGAALGAAAVGNGSVLVFRDAAIDVADWNIVQPPGWNSKTVTIDLYWQSATATAGNVLWQVEFRYLTDNAAFPNGTSSSNGTGAVASGGTQNVHKVTTTLTASATDNAGLAFRVYRNGTAAGDTLTASANLCAVYLHVT